MKIIGQIIAIIVPWQNKTTWQKVGSVLAIIALVASFAATLIPEVPPVVEPVPSPDVIAPLDVPAVDAGAVPGSDVPMDVPSVDPAPVGILGTIVAGLSAPFGCSAAQVQAMKIAGADALSCLLNAGVKEGSVAIKQWGNGQVIDGEGLTQELVLRALPCLLGLGAATVDTYVTGSHYGGSAGERNAYTRHYSITVLPSRAK